MSGKVEPQTPDGNGEAGGDDVDFSFKYGHPKEFDPKFHGPIDKRGCTDVLCLFLLSAFIVGWGVVATIDEKDRHLIVMRVFARQKYEHRVLVNCWKAEIPDFCSKIELLLEAFKYGDPSVLVNPTDSWGQKCGVDENVKDLKYLYFFDITKCAEPTVLLQGCKTPQVCVRECPEEFWSKTISLTRGETEDQMKAKMICKYGVDRSKFSVDELIKKGHCASYLLPSKPKNATKLKRKFGKNPVKAIKSIFSRRCIPHNVGAANLTRLGTTTDVKTTSIQTGIEKLMEFLNAQKNVEYVFEDLKGTWIFIIAFLVIGAVASLIWICLMRCFAGVMVWTSLIGSIAILSYSCYFSVSKYLELKDVPEEDPLEKTAEVDYVTIEYKSQLDTYLKLSKTWLAFSIITGVILGILLFVVLVLRSRLAIAVALIKQGARAVGDMSFTLGWPVVPWILQLIVIGFFILVGIHIASASEEMYKINDNCTCGEQTFTEGDRCYIKKFMKDCGNTTECGIKNACAFVQYQKLSNAGLLHLYNFFGLLWLLCFLEDFGEMVLAGSFAGWYWTFNRKKDLAMFPVMSSISRTARYHLGTLAFGSLIISIIKFIRFFLEYIDYKLRQYGENPIAKAIMCCCRCCFWCLEKFMKFINKNAYIMCSIYGKNFCTSARDAFFLLMRNPVRAFVLDKVTDFLLFLGKILIVGGMAIFSFYVFSGRYGILEEEIPELHFYFIPILIIAVGTYFIATLFFSVYSMAVDTLFLCFLEDCERNDGSQEKPYYMPKELMEILDKRNKPVE